MSAEDYRLMQKIAFKHFKECKVEISDAIKTVFPFLEILRDRGFITNEKYKESKKSCENQSPPQKVVYDVLNELEEKFHLPLLEALFSKVMMKNYPDLNGICEGFRDAIRKKICHQASDGKKSSKNPNIQLSLEQGTSENSYPSLTWLYPDPLNYQGAVPPGNGHSEYISETEQINMKEKDTPNDDNALGIQQASEQHAQKSEPAKRSHEGPSRSSAAKKPPEARNPAVRSGAAEKVSKKHREDVDFRAEILPVTCRGMKGMLYKNKLGQGYRVKCIQTEDGNWFTPKELAVAGGYQQSTKWRKTVRCGGKPLKWLIENGHLPNLQGKNDKGKKSDICEICQYGQNLFRCVTCSRFFHEDCHLPPVGTMRTPWSCTFCRINEFSGSQPVHTEAVVLVRLMGPEEQLKCEFLLLEIYCHSDSNCLMKMQQYSCEPETLQCMENFMLLNEIKKKLSKREYPKVEGFVQDMRLIFQKHRAFNKCNDLYVMGINLEEKFERNFKKVFAIQEVKQEHTDKKIKLEDSA